MRGMRDLNPSRSELDTLKNGLTLDHIRVQANWYFTPALHKYPYQVRNPVFVKKRCARKNRGSRVGKQG
jgi:hypothetical protein